MDNKSDDNVPVDTISPSTQVPQSNSGQSPITIPPPKKSSKRPLIFIAILIVLLVVAGLVYYFLVFNKPDDSSNKQSASSQSTPQTAAQIVAAIKDLPLQGTPSVITKSDATTGKTDSNVYVYSAYPYAVGGRKFATDPEKVFGAGTEGDAAVATADYKAFDTYLTGHGFTNMNVKKIVEDPLVVSDGIYASSSVVCHIQQSDYSKSIDTTVTFKKNLASIACSDLSSYEANSVALDPLYKALTANLQENTASQDQTLYLSGLKIKDGIDGYKNASVGIAYVGAPYSVGLGILYQEPGKDWTLLGVTQNTLECTSLTTTGMKKAFANESCYDPTTLKTVSVKSLL